MGKLITCPVDYVCGHLRDGHYELKLTDEQYEVFQRSTEQEQAEWIIDSDFIVDDYRIEDVDRPQLEKMVVSDIDD